MKGLNPKKRSLKILGLLLLISIGAIYLILPIFEPEPEPVFIESFVLTDLNGDQSDLIEMHQSKFLIINFWATWCGPCRTEIPEFNEFHKAHPDVELLGIAINSGGASKLNPWLKRNPIDYTALVGTDPVQVTYDVSTLPTTVIVDVDGRVRKSFVGAITEQTLTDAVQSVQDS